MQSKNKAEQSGPSQKRYWTLGMIRTAGQGAQGSILEKEVTAV